MKWNWNRFFSINETEKKEQHERLHSFIYLFFSPIDSTKINNEIKNYTNIKVIKSIKTDKTGSISSNYKQFGQMDDIHI